MEAPHVYVVQLEGRGVACCGTLEDGCNLSVVCDDECDDSVWTDADPVSGDPFVTWERVVEALQPHFDSDILEIGAC